MAMQCTYTNFSGGQNNFAGETASPVIVDGGQGTQALMFAEVSQNWEMSENGLIEYPGCISTITSPASDIVTGEFDWHGVHIVCKGTKIYTVAGGTETEIYPLAGTPQTAGYYYQFLETDDGAGTDLLLLMNGHDPVLKYDGSTCSRVTYIDDGAGIWNDARPAFAMSFRNSIFYGGDPNHPHRVYKPRPGSYNNFDNTEHTVDAFDVYAGFGGKLTGLKPLTNDLAVIYKERAILRLEGVNPFGSIVDPIALYPISEKIGCVAPRTIVQVGIEHYFLSEDGQRRLKPMQSYGDVDPQQPTYPIQPTINALNFTSTVIANACSVFHKPSNQIWTALPYGSSTTNNLIVTYDTITQGNDLRAIDDIKASTLTVFDRKVYTGDYNGQIYKHGDDYSYNGVAINAQWESKWIAHNGIGRRKKYRSAMIYAESDGAGDLICQFIVLERGEQRTQSFTFNLAAGNSAWDTAKFDIDVFGSGQEQVIRIKNLGKGNALKIRFINNSLNQRIKIRQVDLFYDLIGSNRG